MLQGEYHLDTEVFLNQISPTQKCLEYLIGSLQRSSVRTFLSGQPISSQQVAAFTLAECNSNVVKTYRNLFTRDFPMIITKNFELRCNRRATVDRRQSA
jgi:hypothetical protein